MFWLKVAFTVAPWAIAFWLGFQVRAGMADHQQLRVQAAAEARTAANQAAADHVGQVHAQAAQAQAERARTIIERVPVYVTREVAADCVLPTGFVRLLNDAAAGVASDPAPGRPDASPAGVALDTVGASVAENYATYNAVRQQLIDLQAFERSQQ